MKAKSSLFNGICLLIISAVASRASAASSPWKDADPQRWNASDIARVLSASPWAQLTGASFALAQEEPPPPPQLDMPQQATVAAPRTAATDGRWDGGVARVNRSGPPTLNVTVRWESALPVRAALARQNTPPPFTSDQARRQYVVAVLGLVPGGRYDSLEPSPAAGSPAPPAGAPTADQADARSPAQILRNILRYSRLTTRSGEVLQADNARIDGVSGTLYLFFPRSPELTLKDKEVIFETRFGSLSVARRFRLKDMLFGGRLEL